MSTDHRAVGDESDEGGRRQHAQADDEDLLERFEVVRIEARVNDVEEDGRDLGRSGEGVLDGRAGGEQLGRQLRGRDVLVVGREGVSRQAEGADPKLGSEVQLATE